MDRRSSLLLLALLASACGKHQGDRELRGTSTPSKDGKTYLAVDDLCASETYLDGERWPHALSVAAVVSPGRHELSCSALPGNGIAFQVKPSMTFHFNYWGP